MRSVFNRVKYISLIIILYIVCEYTVVTSNGARGKWWVFGIYYLIDIFFFYFNCYFVYPRAYNKRKTLYQPFLFVVGSISIYYFVSVFANVVAINGVQNFVANLKHSTLVSFGYRVFILSSLTAIPFGFSTYIRMLKRERMLENNALYSRISPHLIFNALNFIHADVRSVSPDGAKMITYVSEYARYAMTELAEDGKVNLEAELKMLEILKGIQQLRFGSLYLSVKIEMNRPVYEYRIPPQLILTLAENLFKYGNTNDEAKQMSIEVFDRQKLLHVHMFNWKADNNEAISHKIGLDNLRKRLKNIYEDFYSMKIVEDANTFSIHITLPI